MVKISGRPESKSLWTNPKNDQKFTQAVKQNRVLTVIPGIDAKKREFGEIGFRRILHANYFVFPKPLPKSPAKVIGIKYDLVEEPEPGDLVTVQELERAAKAGRLARENRDEPSGKMFKLLVRTVGVMETILRIKARSRRAARAKAAEIANGQAFDPTKAKISREIAFRD